MYAPYWLIIFSSFSESLFFFFIESIVLCISINHANSFVCTIECTSNVIRGVLLLNDRNNSPLVTVTRMHLNDDSSRYIIVTKRSIHVADMDGIMIDVMVM